MIYPHVNLLKTDARFGMSVPSRITSVSSDVTNDVESFDWRTKKTLSTAQNQGTCGSCWAVATTTAVADHFAIKFENAAPKLSYTRNMICYSQDPCSGGNPASLLKLASESDLGFVEEACISETEWCGGECTAEHFKSVYGKCGCEKEAEYKCFPIDKGSVQWLTLDNENADEFIKFVKKWIVKEGPLVAAFPVFSNFKKELFENGVYLESKTLDNKYSNEEALAPHEFLGFHAVVVVGFGVEHGLATGPKRNQNVPYWLCRNSWGATWNGDGHFKMPCFPFNSTAQFEKPVSIRDINGTDIHQAGGFVSFTTTKKPFLAKIPKTILIDKTKNWKITSFVLAAILVSFLIIRIVYGIRLRFVSQHFEKTWSS